jgi:hypothetical protein
MNRDAAISGVRTFRRLVSAGAILTTAALRARPDAAG